MDKKALHMLSILVRKVLSTSRGLPSYIDFLGKLLIVIGIVGVVMISFYWDFGFQPFKIKSIYTPDTGLLSLSIDPMYCLALIFALVFYVGYRLYVERKPSREIRLPVGETERQILVKHLLCVVLGVLGAWVLYNEFSRPLMWGYYIWELTQIGRVSFSERIVSVIALLLLLIWFLVPEIRVRQRYE